jgi:hypothetical protein
VPDPVSAQSTRQNVDEWVLNNIDSETIRPTEDGAFGLNCLTRESAFLTFVAVDGIEQPYVTRADLEWMRDVGIPAWLAEMDRADG